MATGKCVSSRIFDKINLLIQYINNDGKDKNMSITNTVVVNILNGDVEVGEILMRKDIICHDHAHQK